MESMNKYTVLATIIILTFLFCVGAIYSNTRDLKNNKENLDKTKIEIKNNGSSKTETETTKISNDYSDILERLNNLDEKISKLENRQNTSSNENSLNCGIVGIMTSSGIDKMTSTEAIEEISRNSDNELVITCTMK